MEVGVANFVKSQPGQEHPGVGGVAVELREQIQRLDDPDLVGQETFLRLDTDDLTHCRLIICRVISQHVDVATVADS